MPLSGTDATKSGGNLDWGQIANSAGNIGIALIGLFDGKNQGGANTPPYFPPNSPPPPPQPPVSQQQPPPAGSGMNLPPSNDTAIYVLLGLSLIFLIMYFKK